MDSHALAVSPAHPGTVVLANRMGVFESNDRGESWREGLGIGRFSPLTNTRDVQVSPHDPERLYAAFSIASVSDAGSLYVSDDFGADWHRFDTASRFAARLWSSARATPRPIACTALPVAVRSSGPKTAARPGPSTGCLTLSGHLRHCLSLRLATVCRRKHHDLN